MNIEYKLNVSQDISFFKTTSLWSARLWRRRTVNRIIIVITREPRSALTLKEKSFPVAYVITAYMDPRNLGPGSVIVKLTRPHNSYCVHVDPSSDSMFR